MNKVELEISSWNRFITRHFVVEPDLLGQSHEFEFENHKVRVELPSTESLSKTGDQQPHIDSCRVVDGHKIPLDIHIPTVDISILLPDRLVFPAEILNRPVKAPDLFPENQQKGMDTQVARYGEFAERAFDLWIRTLRWKCNSGVIGRPEVRGAKSGWSTYLVDESTKKRIWAEPGVLTVAGYKRVTIADWNEVGRALDQGTRPPIFVDLMFDGEQNLELGDLQRATVDLAVSCEIFMRSLLTKQLPEDLNDALCEYIEDANIRQVLNRFLPEILDETENKILRNIKPDLQRLFDARNDILHAGHKEDLGLDDCKRHLEVTRRLISSALGNRLADHATTNLRID